LMKMIGNLLSQLEEQPSGRFFIQRGQFSSNIRQDEIPSYQTN